MVIAAILAVKEVVSDSGERVIARD